MKNLTQSASGTAKDSAQQLKLDFGPDFVLEVPRWLSSSSQELAKLIEEERANTNNKAKEAQASQAEVERGEMLRRLIVLYERDLSRLKSRLAEEEQTEK